MRNQNSQPDGQDTIDDHLISFFQDGVRILGLPKSLGEIYGSLYVSQKPLTMLDLIEKLHISKGSASQGLKTLKTLGAVNEVTFEHDRKTYFKANCELKKLVGGFVREEIKPHLKSGQHKLEQLESELKKIDDPDQRKFYEEKITRLSRWASKANLMLPLLQHFLGK